MAVANEHGFLPAEMCAATGLAFVARRQGELDEAEKHLRAVLEWHQRCGFTAGSTLILAELGFVAEYPERAEAVSSPCRSPR